METAREVVEEFNALPEREKEKAATEIRRVAPLPPPPAQVVGPLWLMVVGAFVLVFLFCVVALYLLTQDDKETDVIFPIVTGVMGVLAGLLAPSPTAK